MKYGGTSHGGAQLKIHRRAQQHAQQQAEDRAQEWHSQFCQHDSHLIRFRSYQRTSMIEREYQHAGERIG